MAQHKMEEERNRIREERARLLREEKRLFEEEREKLKEQEAQDEEESDKTECLKSPSKKPSRLDKSFTEFDILAKKKKEEEREKIMRESQRKLEEEKRMFQEAKKMMEENEDSGEDAELEESKPGRLPQKLSKNLTDFEEMERQRKEDERDRAYREKLFHLEQEKKLFAEARKLQQDESDEEKDEGDFHQPQQNSPNKLSSVLSKFEQTEEERIQKERTKLQKRKIKEMEEELKRFQEEREQMNDSDKEEKGDIPTPQVKQPRPRKLASSFTKFDEIARMKQEEERRKMREEKAKELAEERRRFQESRETGGQNGSESDNDHSTESNVYRPISRINVRQQMEAVLQAQKEIEQKRIMETKFCRMTVEQQEMYLAKEKQLQLLREKLAQAEAEFEYESYTSEEYTDDEDRSDEEYSSGEEQEDLETYGDGTRENLHRITEPADSADDESRCSSQALRDDMSTPGSNDSGYTGAPWFTETLSNVTLTEGKPVRFDAVVHADPHPKVTWFFQNRLIQNSVDYQYINKGTQYSLYMNESFVDDTGEYICKAENCKGVATSKAVLTVIEMDG